MIIGSYDPRGSSNQNQVFKSGLEKILLQYDFSAGCPTSTTITTVGAVAVNAGNGTVTSTCIGTCAVTGYVASISCLTMGTSGGAASDGERFRITTTATVSNGENLSYDTFILIQAPTYGPSS